MKLPRVRTIKRQIAVTGTARSGKTVFLTSLVNHLLEHDPSEFEIGPHAVLSQTKMVKLPKSERPFNYDHFRDSLSRADAWPEKTSDCSNCVLTFARSDWSMSTAELRLFDFPGERFADAGIAVSDTFEEWSDGLLDYMHSKAEYRELATPYFDLLGRNTVERSELLAGYKGLLVTLFLNHKPLISPSTFLLDRGGKQLDPNNRDTYLAERYCGLDRDHGNSLEFVPLGPDFRARHSELTTEFAEAFRVYRREVAEPLFDRIRNSHALVILVDVVSILAGGVGRFNDTHRTLKDFLELYSPKSGLQAIWRWVSFNNTKTRRIAFVVPKSDLVRQTPEEQDRLVGLLKQMTRNLVNETDIECEWFSCSAVVSTLKGEREECLKGRVVRADNPDRRMMEYEISAVPDAWPGEWQPGEYHFYYVAPRMPKNVIRPPRQRGLNDVFDYICGA